MIKFLRILFQYGRVLVVMCLKSCHQLLLTDIDLLAFISKRA
jgi:hypothetical protein